MQDTLEAGATVLNVETVSDRLRTERRDSPSLHQLPQSHWPPRLMQEFQVPMSHSLKFHIPPKKIKENGEEEVIKVM